MEGIRTTPGKNTTRSHYFSTFSWWKSSQFVVWIWSISRVLIWLLFFFLDNFVQFYHCFLGRGFINFFTILENWIWSLSWEDPLEKEMATHSSILAWRIPWTEDSGGLQSMGFQRVGHDYATNFLFFFYYFIARKYPPSNTSLFSLFLMLNISYSWTLLM